ncbi:MAG TPA: hypothetical protein VFC68_02435 [Treponemataceae bacterium]|nr:hypothetical protein [Treponemataceae bacterium]
MKKRLILIVAAFAFTSMIFANNQNYFTDYSITDYSSAIGINAQIVGKNIVPQLQYHHWFSSRFGLELAGGAVYSVTQPHTGLDYLISADIQYLVYENIFTDAFAADVFMWGQAGHRGYTTNNTFKADITLATGIGSEFLIAKHFSIPLKVGYLVQFPNTLMYTISASAGLRFRF